MYRPRQRCSGVGISLTLEQLKPAPRGVVGKHSRATYQNICCPTVVFFAASLSFAPGRLPARPSSGFLLRLYPAALAIFATIIWAFYSSVLAVVVQIEPFRGTSTPHDINKYRIYPFPQKTEPLWRSSSAIFVSHQGRRQITTITATTHFFCSNIPNFQVFLVFLSGENLFRPINGVSHKQN